jgi:hypothetical protein
LVQGIRRRQEPSPTAKKAPAASFGFSQHGSRLDSHDRTRNEADQVIEIVQKSVAQNRPDQTVQVLYTVSPQGK